ncbi:MAG: cell division protein FtsA, partial [Firmicutes bacterium]|nr:cell division protein FtsA [Bacillota bacterium]
AEVCLSRDEKELGVFLIDIGGGTTEIALFKEGGLQDLAVLPVGGDHITNDLAVGLKVTFQTAEDIKLSHGSALSKLTNPESFVEVKGISGKETKRISEEELNRYIEPRVEEMLQLALLEMEKTGYVQMPPAGIVLTGGVSLMRGVMEMAENIFGCSVRVATPQYLGVKSPIYSTAVGILQYVYRNNMASLQERSDSKVGLSGLWYRLRKWFSELWE